MTSRSLLVILAAALVILSGVEGEEDAGQGNCGGGKAIMDSLEVLDMENGSEGENLWLQDIPSEGFSIA